MRLNPSIISFTASYTALPCCGITTFIACSISLKNNKRSQETNYMQYIYIMFKKEYSFVFEKKRPKHDVSCIDKNTLEEFNQVL